MPTSTPPTPELIAVLTAAAVSALGRDVRVTAVEPIDDPAVGGDKPQNDQPSPHNEATP
ncbi:MAG: hypothetical protein AAGH99_08425 [Planctomycetota bacterium]